jgi:L-asparaginase
LVLGFRLWVFAIFCQVAGYNLTIVNLRHFLEKIRDSPDDPKTKSQKTKTVKKMKIKFYATGGTIDKIYFDAKSEYQVGAPQVEEILKDSNVAFAYEVESILQKDSLEMTDEDRKNIRQIIENESCERIVITHGTDTMVETAKFLIGIPDKTIVFTGAMEPARSRYTDATFNVGCAIGAVQVLPAGVYIAMNGCVYEANKVVKNYEAKRFEALPIKN